MGSYVTRRREALIGVSTGEGVAAVRGHSTKHSTGHRRQIPGQTAARSPPPAAHSPSRKSTPHYTIGYSTPAKEGGRGSLHYCKDGGGVLAQPRRRDGTGEGEAEGGGRRKAYAQGGTGDLKPGSGHEGVDGGPGQWPSQRRNGTWQGEGPRLGEPEGVPPAEKPDPGLRISVHWVPNSNSLPPQPRDQEWPRWPSLPAGMGGRGTRGWFH